MVGQRAIFSVTAAAALAALALVSGPRRVAVGAEPPDPSVARSAATAWWPTAAVERALSYIRVTPSDLSLRTDYVPRDSFRLWGVDQMMEHPDRMTEVLADASTRVFRNSSLVPTGKRHAPFDLDWPELTQLVLGPASLSDLTVPSDSTADSVWARVLLHFRTEAGKTRRAPSDTLASLPHEWQRFLGTVCAALADTGWTDTTLSNLGSEDREFVMTQALEFVEEDEADKDKTEEVLDSLQKAEDLDAKRFAEMGGAIRWKWIHEHGTRVVSRLLQLIPLQAPSTDSLWPMQSAPIVYHSPLGDFVFGTKRNDHYTGNPAIIIDPGGNDTYELDPLPAGHHRMILDYGGDDGYSAPAGDDLGAARFGWSILVDFAGDDTYRAGSFSLGSGWFGIGLLFDLDGRDIYIGDTHTQGAGSFGVGILYDAATSNDQYSARLYAQGLGFAGGLGILADAGGNDIYTAGGKYEDILRYRDHYISLSQGFGSGIRPHFSGGIGLLLDRSGNDTYVADIFAQGCSYWWAFGGLLDGGGNDQYTAYQYAQGSATHMTAGCLYDVSGDDRYESKGVSQGCGHDWAVAILIDSSGNDRYIATDLSQGAGSANGIGILIDGRGNDGYYATSAANTQGYGNPRREYGSIGLFLDLAGSDRYDGPGRDKSVWLGSSQWGVGVDADSAWVMSHGEVQHEHR